MYCEKCKVSVDGNINECPLCHNDLTKTADEKCSCPAFPRPTPAKNNRNYFVYIYILVAALIMAPIITLNFYYDKEFLWCVIMLVLLSYIGFFIRTVLIGKIRFILNLTAQAFVLTIMFFAVHAVTKTHYWLLNIWQPSIYIFSYILLLLYIKIESFELGAANLINTFLLCILGQIPIITAYTLPLPNKVPSIVSSALGCLFLVCIAIFYRKYIFSEAKKFFHL